MATSNTSVNLPPVIGEVQSVTGRVVAIGLDGAERQLVPGDPVHADDVIRTIGVSTVAVSLNDGTRLDLGRDSEAQLDESVYGTDIPALRAAALADVAEIQRAIAEGADPTLVAEPPSAGADSGVGGGDTLEEGVVVARTGRIGLVEAGYETAGLERGIEQNEYPVGDIIDSGDEAAPASNNPPVANDDSVNTDEDTPITLTNADIVDPNDTDLDGDTLTITAVGNPTNGSVVLNPDGTVTFTPDVNYNGPATFEYTISDGNGGTDMATVTVNVAPVNDAPVAVNDNVGTAEDTPLTLGLADIVDPNDFDVDGDALTIIGVANPVNGAVVLNPDGTVTFTPAANFIGHATFEYTISDGNGGSDTATVTVNVGGVNDPPDAADDTVATNEDTPITLTNADIVDPNDTDLDGDTLTITAVGNPTNGSVVLNPDGTVTFTPDANYNGPATFEYTISDGNGGTDTATVTVNVNPVNDAPDAVDDTVSTNEDTPITLTNADIVDPNDTDLDGDTLTITAVGNPTNGTVVLNPDGTVTFTPDANYNGPATFEYTISDGNGGTDTATVTVNVGAANDDPDAVDDVVATDEDTPITLTNADIVDPNDTDLDGDTLTITAVGNPTNGSVVLNPDGTVTFTPDANYNGPATFEYTISDGNGGTDTATVTVNINPVNDAPDAVDDTVSTNEDTPITLANADIVDPNDTDLDGDALTITAVGNPTNGSVVLNPDGTVTFTPDANYNGPATFEYTISDGNGGTDTATVTVNVNSVNDAPDAVDDVVATDEDTPITLGTADIVDPNDTDLDGDTLTIIGVANPSSGSVVLNPDGSVTYTPAPNFVGIASFEYTISDGNGGTDTATVAVTVGGVNDPPDAVDDTVSTNEDTPITLTNADIVDPNDTDLDGDALTITAVGNPTNGSVVLNPDGTVTFTPDANYNGPATFEYTISDGNGGTDTATVTVNVNPVNDAPDAVDDTVATNEDTPITLTNADIVDPNDTDLDGDTLTITAVGNPTNGTVVLNPDGTVTFTPDANYNGPATFEYTISDGNGGTDTATVTVNVNPVNDAPDAVDDTVSTNEDTPITLTNADIVDPNDTDLDGDALTITAVGNPTNGTVVLNLDGTVTFTPDANYNGPATFEYTISDGNGGTDTATVTVNVNPVNDAPDAVDDTVSTNEDTPITLTNADIVDPNDTDLDGDTLTITAVGNPTNGTVVLNPDGTVTFTPDANYNGTAAFEYTISDGNGGTDTATVIVNVVPVDDLPVIMPLVGSVSEEGLFGGLHDDNPLGIDTTDSSSVTGSMNLFDPDGDAISSVTLSAPADGAFTSGGVAVTWSGSGTSTLTASAGGTPVATLTIDNAGSYTFDLLAPLDHVGDAGQEGVLSLGFGVDVTANGQTSSLPAALTIQVEDDSPAQIDPGSATVAVIDTNLLVILDVSGSMSANDGVNGTSRLESAIQSINTLLDSYEDLGMVKVRLVTFSTGAQEQGAEWMTADEARAALATLSASGNTNYDAALDTAQTAFTDAGAIAGAQNLAYFFSDGEPNRPSGSAGIDAQEEADWRGFLTGNEINAFAIGIGNGLSSTDPINPIAYDGQGARDTDASLVTDFAQLDELLAGTVLTTTGGYLHASGEIGGGSLFGADGGHIQAITAEGTTYTFDPVSDTVIVTGTDHSTFDPATDLLVITTGVGGVLSVDLTSGMYSYTAPSGVDPASGGMTLDYTVVDMDGDTASSSVEIEVVRTNVQIDSGTFSGTDGADLLVGRPLTAATSVTGSVGAGSTFSSGDNQFAFTFGAGDGSVSVSRISIDLRAGGDSNAIFDTVGSNSYGPALGTLVGIGAGDITFSPASGQSDSPVLTIDFVDGSFGVGDTIRFGVDTDGLGGDTGADFATSGVVFTVTFSDGSVVAVPYSSDGASGSAATASVDIAVDGVTIDGLAGDDILVGTDLDDVLDGGADADQLRGEDGNDILVGGSGNDILSGGSAADSFVWNAGDGGEAGFPAVDTITDFSLADGDALDLHDLLQDEQVSGDLTAYLSFEQQGADAIVHISSNGGFDAGYSATAEDQTIVLQNVDLSALGGNDALIIDALIAGNHLITD
ncbi:MAG: retention module-containing protein [Chromatiaceae bacterium]|nr:retention module-containing protein [Chromatiaceae bacterium]